MRLGYCTWGMQKVPFEEAAPAIAGLGYSGLELAVTRGFSTELSTMDAAARKSVRELLTRHGLALTAVAGHTGMIDRDPEANERNMQRLRDTLDLAVDLAREGEQPIVCSCVRGRPEDFDPHKALLAERVHELGEYAASRGAILAVEPHTGTALDTPQKVVWLLDRVNHPAVRLNLDNSHFDVMGFSIDEYVPLLAPYSVHTHVKDQRGRYPDSEFLTPGEGPFDYVHFLKAMQAAGYNDYVMVEVSMMVQRRPGYDPFFHAQLAYWTLDKALKVAGIARDDVAVDADG